MTSAWRRRPTGPFGIRTDRAYSPEQAQAMIANAIANPIPAYNGTVQLHIGKNPGGFGARPGYHIEDPQVADQGQPPERPETRYFTNNSYGKVIPISMGRRRVTGTIIQCSDLKPSLVGNRTYSVYYPIPIYEDPPANPTLGYSISPENHTRDDPGGMSCGAGDACNPRSISPETGGGGGGGGDPVNEGGTISITVASDTAGQIRTTITPPAGAVQTGGDPVTNGPDVTFDYDLDDVATTTMSFGVYFESDDAEQWGIDVTFNFPGGGSNGGSVSGMANATSKTININSETGAISFS